MRAGGTLSFFRAYVMKISFPTLNDATHQFSKSFAAAVERDSGGRIEVEFYPGEPARLDPAPDRGRAVRFDSMRRHPARVLRRRR
jgi:hypothetical protein